MPIQTASTMTLLGARALARQIEEYWEERGYYVKCRVLPEVMRADTSSFVVRSNLGMYMPGPLVKYRVA